MIRILRAGPHRPFIRLLIVQSAWALLFSSLLAAAEPVSLNVGHRLLEIARTQGADDPRPMTLALWYPTQAAPSCHTYNDPAKTTSHVALNAAPAPGPHPLILFSHGYGGAGIASIYLTEYLASQGFIVAAPDHEDRNFIVRSKAGEPLKERWYSYNVISMARSGKRFDHAGQAHRSKDLIRTLDELLSLNHTKDSPLYGAINPDQIGVAGHSLGGYTALRVCGISGTDADPRIKAALLLTAGVYMFKAEDYSGVHVPVMFMFGEVETARWRTLLLNDKMADSRRAYDNCAPPKYMIEIKGANHFSFSQGLFEAKWPGLGTEKAGPVADVIKAYSLAFLRRWLLKDLKADDVLNTPSPLFLLYEKQVQ